MKNHPKVPPRHWKTHRSLRTLGWRPIWSNWKLNNDKNGQPVLGRLEPKGVKMLQAWLLWNDSCDYIFKSTSGIGLNSASNDSVFYIIVGCSLIVGFLISVSFTIARDQSESICDFPGQRQNIKESLKLPPNMVYLYHFSLIWAE
jgi:hypothetical protein